MKYAQFVEYLEDINAKENCDCEVRDKSKTGLNKKYSNKSNSGISFRNANNKESKENSRQGIQKTVSYFSLFKNVGASKSNFEPHHNEKLLG